MAPIDDSFLKDTKIPTSPQAGKNPVGRHGPLLADIQGNILTGHGRDHELHIFLEFEKKKTTKTKIKKWIKEFSAHVTSAQRQYKEADAWRKQKKEHPPNGAETDKLLPGIDDLLFVNFFLSAEGYDFLKLANKGPQDSAFQAGMKSRNLVLNDPSKEEWEESFRSESIHAMILIANDSPEMLKEPSLSSSIGLIIQQNMILNGISEPIAKILFREQGERIFKDFRGLTRAVEHFGYVDGMSQPRFILKDEEIIARDWRDGGNGGSEQWLPWAPLNLVLVPDPFGGPNAAGSFLVYRKLEQNVRKFQTLKHTLIDTLRDSTNGPSVAYAVGRFQDGTPVTRLPNYNFPINDFNFKAYKNLSTNLSDDQAKINNRDVGIRCPFHAHIRKVNPRENSPNDTDDLDRRIVRRGIPYDNRRTPDQPRVPPPTDTTLPETLPSKDVGLLFLCFQRDIAAQFEYIQRKANGAFKPESLETDFDTTAVDPIIGQHSNPQAQVWPAEWNVPSKGNVPFSFSNVVSLKGGEYFFAPSISFLKKIHTL